MKLFLSFLFLAITSCHRASPTPSVTPFESIAMEMKYKILIGKTLNPTERQEVEKIISSTFTEIDNLYNNWNPQSEISQLNQLPAGKKIVLSPKLAAFLQTVHCLHQLTQGRFDPTIQPLAELWKNRLQKNKIPTDEELKKILPAVGWEKIHIEKGLFWKDHTRTGLDLGTIAKGYCVDLLAARLTNAGYPDHFVEWAGGIRTGPSGKKWQVEVTGGPTVIDLENQSIATSGSDIASWTVDNITYTHIIDPKTKAPLSPGHIASVSVVTKSCTVAHGLATALMVFPNAEEATRFASSLPNVKICHIRVR